MKKDILIPQGKFKVGRDIPEGIYLIAAMNGLSFVSIDGANDEYESFTLKKENAMMCHVELKNGDTLIIDGKVKLRLITKFISKENGFCLLDEIENFQKSLSISKVTKKYDTTVDDNASAGTEEFEDEEAEREAQTSSTPKQKVGFWSALAALLAASSEVSSSSRTKSNADSPSSQKKRHSGRCDGDCANCPPHYGYRHGRWYYGHDHIEGCVFGGNKGGGG